VKSEQIINALAIELKTPLTQIAREAEVAGITGVSRQAEEIMALIDGYLLSSQTERGQQVLPLQTTAIGSILYDVAQDVRELAIGHQVDVEPRTTHKEAVMTHARSLRIALSCLAQLATYSSAEEGEESRPRIKLLSYIKSNGSVVAGVFSRGIQITEKDLKRAELLYGESHLALSTSMPGSGVRLAIASGLAESLGSKLVTLRRDSTSGLGLELMRSTQLQLI
jgi:hypothetical protein